MRTRQNFIGRIVLTVVTAGFIGFIFSNSLLASEQSSANSTGVLNAVQNLLGSLGIASGLTEHIIRKAAHFTEFAALGALLMVTVRMYSPRPARHIFLPLFIGLGTAVTDEYLQLFVEGRSSQVSDVLLDFSGVAAGLLICLLIISLIDRHKQRKTPRFRF